MTSTCLDQTVGLILEQQSNLRGLARSLAGCHSEADDLVQETLLRAYRARDRFQPGTSMRAWTGTILRRLFFTSVRHRNCLRVQTDTDTDGALGRAGARSSSRRDEPVPDVEALGDELDDTLKRALHRLPQVNRTAFFLLVVREMSCAEIGRALRIPIGTVMSRIHRARARLRGDLLNSRRIPLPAAARVRRLERPPARSLART